MDVLITKSNESFRLSKTAIIPLRFLVSSIEMNWQTAQVEGSDGNLTMGVDDISRKITVPFFFEGKQYYDFPLIRDELFSIFGKECFYISEVSDTSGIYTGKRYFVRLSNVITIEQMETDGRVGQGELQFETTETPYGQSIYTTQEIQKNGVLVDKYWAFGMGLETVDDSELIYTHQAIAGQKIRIFNAGNVEVHPFESYLKVTIHQVVGSTEKFQLTNLTNGSRLRINVPVNSSDTWVYDGPIITRNSLAATKDTQKNFIYLSPGWNTLQVYYCDSAEVSFDFCFLYR